MNRNVKLLGRRFYSPSLKDVAWLEDAQLIFLIFNTFVCKFGWVDKRLDTVRGKKFVSEKSQKKNYYLLQDAEDEEEENFGARGDASAET